jgi:hypothetical protein
MKSQVWSKPRTIKKKEKRLLKKILKKKTPLKSGAAPTKEK